MTDLFDANGNATETHIVKVSGYEKGTGEHTATYDVRILAGTGIPGFSTLILAPTAEVGHAVCWSGADWKQITDLRGKTAYQKSNGEPITVKKLGELDDAYTLVPPLTDFDIWNGREWATDVTAQKDAAVADAEQYRDGLVSAALESIAVIQLKLQASRTLTDDEQNQLDKTLDYIDAVKAMKTDILPVDWPSLD